MLLNYRVGEDSWESLGPQGDPTSPILKEISPEYSLEGLILKLKLQYFGHLMWRTDHLKRPWCWVRLKAGGEGHDRGWDRWMAPMTQWTWVWVSVGAGDGQGGLKCSSPWDCKESDATEWLNWRIAKWVPSMWFKALLFLFDNFYPVLRND